MNFVKEPEVGAIREIEKFYGTRIDEMPADMSELL